MNNYSLSILKTCPNDLFNGPTVDVAKEDVDREASFHCSLLPCVDFSLRYSTKRIVFICLKT